MLIDLKGNQIGGAGLSIIDDDKLDDIGGTSMVDEQLAEIVLVKKNEMEEWQRKQELLKYDLNVNKKKVEQKLYETKMKYDRQYKEIEK